MHRALVSAGFALVLLLIAIVAEPALAGHRRARREARRYWSNGCRPCDCVPQVGAPGSARVLLPPPNMQPTGISSDHGVAAASATPVSAEARAFAAANNAFALDLYRRLSEGEGNRFFSPIGISAGLALVATGASGETRQQIFDVVHLDLPAAKFLSGFKDLNARLGSGGNGYQLRMANRLWIQDGFALTPEFLNLARDGFGAEPGRVDFGDRATALATINRWVVDQTEGRITELLPPQLLNEKTRFVLTNGIYFKGTWKFQFVPAATAEAPFHVGPERDVTVRMMQQIGAHRYAATDALQVLELPYAGDHLAMVILLPKKVDGLRDLESSLTAEGLGKWLAPLEEEGEVEIHLPKFTMTQQVPLKDPLASLGMLRAFSNEAEFPGISSEKAQQLQTVVQQSFIEVNEAGTEAAAVTGFIGGDAPSPVPQHILFKADHPFVFLIRDLRTGAILFLGRVENPAP